MLVNFAIQTVINGVALWVAAWAVPGITFGTGQSTSSTFWTVAVVALIFGLVNALVRPIAALLSLPFIILTLGLFIFILNAAMLQLTSWLAGKFDLAFHVDEFFWDAIWGSLIITFVSLILGFFKRSD
jgi:putative membrane protein